MLSSWRRYADSHPHLVETAFLLLVLAVTSRQYVHQGPGWWQGQPLALVATAGLLPRRGHPRAAVLVTAACAAASVALGYLISPLLLLPVLIALYELAVRTPQRTAYACYGATVALVVPAALLSARDGRPWMDESVGPVFWILLPVLAGTAVRNRRAHLDAVHTRAEHAERTREEEARHRVAEERIRIARELHDVVAHHMALANAQASTAAHLARTHPEQAHEILAHLTGTTASALRELKATVGLLRTPDDTGDTGGPDDLRPPPGLGRLPELVSAFGSAGLHVTVTVRGTRRPLPPGVDLTAFRIVQEALTNVTKHTDAGTADVHLAYAHDRLTLTVTDDGGASPRPPGPGGGFGLVGMRERAETSGGGLSAGTLADGGFAVTAELPAPPPAREQPS
ncbi:sensor histidine kinase [Streptomyces lividans]|uniref:histidine kinase n=2 Tax=Streptomyces TaxID=1883 RepID=A0ABM5RCC1_STRLI|nr:MULTISPECIES: histidine kinase [Streptomyces]QSJ13658.1 two-component sensor kinase [Streptomyces lividans]AIJ18041.1 two-component sensor kinase [Streptomyces lividans TK24]EFD71538.1 two-component sensor kinase [Streptomyces lividans TK24]KKD17353.1 histidine kinase [Streptomyces sp. WM6391]QTD74568.1 two-component sensor kinase [Streptomyces lividans TK24] [Streptomyces lividans]